MSKETPNCITERHLIFFGAIIQSFACHEVLVQEIMATVSGADATSIKLLISALDFTEKRDVLFNLLRHRAVPRDHIDQLQSYFEVLRTFTQLRNDIAHSVWVEGKPDNLIWPVWLTHGPLTAVKAMHDIDEHARDFVEDDTYRVGYSVDDLKEIAERLELNYASAREYAAEVGLIASNAA